MKFEDYRIADNIKRSLAELGFRRPTDIQYKAIPSILNNDDVLAVAQTGTGKTAAFAIPILHSLQKLNTKNSQWQVSCLVMVPTRELAIQIADVFKQIGKHTSLRILGMHGGITQDEQIKELRKGVDVLVATPGRMFDLINQQHLDLSKVNTLILDEADQMLKLGFYKDIQDVQRHIPLKHQTLFFSATIDKEIKDLAYKVVKNPIRIQISPKDPISKNVTHKVAYVEMDDKRFFLERLIKEFPDKKVLVFVRTKVRAERVAAAMSRVQIETLTMHSGKEQDDRLAVMNAYKTGSTNILITTDVNARGVDIPGVDYVVNYDLPDAPDQYVHRVGRTGRGVAKGNAVSFCSKEELLLLQAIKTYIGKEITELTIDINDYNQTIALSEDIPNTNWQNLLEENEKNLKSAKRKKKKR